MRYDARELAALAAGGLGVPGRAQARRRRRSGSRRRPPSVAGDRLKPISVLEIVNDDMPFLVNSVLGELAERGLDIRLVVHPVFTRRARRRRARSIGFHGDAPGRRRGAARKLHPHPRRAHRRRGAARRDRARRIEEVLADVRVCVHDWRAMMARVARGDRRAQGQSAAAAGRARSPRRSSSWNG